jgi:putative endonuclease
MAAVCVVLSEAKNPAPRLTAGRSNHKSASAWYLEGSAQMKTYFVYIMTNHARTVYAGITSDLPKSVLEQKDGLTPGFTSRYRLTSHVYYEEASDVQSAIAREKQIKGWLRKKKLDLIESMNPFWFDLSDVLIGESSSLEPDSSLRSERPKVPFLRT